MKSKGIFKRRIDYKITSYMPTEESDTSIDSLIAFFWGELSFGGSSIIECLQDDQCEGFDGNAVYGEKRNGKLYLGDLYAETYPDAYELETTEEELIAAIKAWVKLTKEAPEYILLMYDNGNIVVEGKSKL